MDTDYYSPSHFPEKERDGQFRIITVANLVGVKGIEVLIEAVLALNNPKIMLTVLGDDRSEYAIELKQKVKSLDQGGHILFLGKHTDVRPFLANADLYVIPSKKEGMPMALVEAMSMRIPVLGSAISGIQYVLKDFQDLLFEASNIKQLAEKIDFMYKKSNDERQILGNELRNYTIHHFSMDRFITAHENLYFSLVNKEIKKCRK